MTYVRGGEEGGEVLLSGPVLREGMGGWRGGEGGHGRGEDRGGEEGRGRGGLGTTGMRGGRLRGVMGVGSGDTKRGSGGGGSGSRGSASGRSVVGVIMGLITE